MNCSFVLPFSNPVLCFTCCLQRFQCAVGSFGWLISDNGDDDEDDQEGEKSQDCLTFLNTAPMRADRM